QTHPSGHHYLHQAFSFDAVFGGGLELAVLFAPVGLSNLTVPPPTFVLLVVLAILELVAAVGAKSVEDGFCTMAGLAVEDGLPVEVVDVTVADLGPARFREFDAVSLVRFDA